jgi:putative DNA primase/helicase
LAQTKHRLSIPIEYWDADRDAFVCANGVINLRTGVLSPHSPEHLVTTGSAVVYDVTAECPLWEAFLPQAQPDPEVRRYLQALMGYCLTGRINMEQIYFLKGKGGNGKGTFIETLRFIFADYAVVVSRTLILRQHNSEPHPTNLAALRGKHWATVSELPLNAELDSAVMKQLCGGDKQTARKMHQDFSDFDMQATITVDTNDIPRLQEYSPAIRRRVRLIDWKADFEGREDRKLKDSLKLEASGIFNWMLAGVQLYYAGELDNVPEAVKEATAEFWAGMNTVGQWLTEICVIEAGGRTNSTALVISFSKWSHANQIPTITKKPFLAKLRMQDIPGLRIKEAGGQTWVFGLRLKNKVELETVPPVEEDAEPIPAKPMATATNAYSDSAVANLPVKKSKFERVS